MRRWARRNRTAVTAAGVALLAGVAGLAAVLVVQTQAKADIAKSLASETRANAALADANTKVRARYELALDAISTFHTGVSEDFLLKQEQFKELRDRLLKSASGFYGKLSALLGKETDFASRRALSASNFELARLTGKVGRSEDALAAHRAVLTARESLAAEPGADVGARVEIGRSLLAVGSLLEATGHTGEAMEEYLRAETLLAALALTETAARIALADCHNNLGTVLWNTGKPAKAAAKYRKALAIQQKLADDNPAVTEFRSSLALSHNNFGLLLLNTGKPAEAEAEYRKAPGDPAEAGRRQPRRHRLPQPSGGQPQEPRPSCCRIRASRRRRRPSFAGPGDPAEAGRRQPRRHRVPQPPGGQPRQPRHSAVRVRASRRRRRPSTARRWRSSRSWPTTTPPSPNSAAAWRPATTTSANCCRKRASRRRRRPSTARRMAIQQKLADDNPAVTDFRSGLADSHNDLGDLLSETGKPAEAEVEFRKAMAIQQKLADDNPAVTEFRSVLAYSHINLGNLLSHMGKPAEAEAEYRKALAILQKLADDNPAVTQFRGPLADSHNSLGALLSNTGKPAEAEAEYRQAPAIFQKLASDNPSFPEYRGAIARSLAGIGDLLTDAGHTSEAIDCLVSSRHPGRASPGKPLACRKPRSPGLQPLGPGGRPPRGNGRRFAVADLRRAIALWEGSATLTLEARYRLCAATPCWRTSPRKPIGLRPRRPAPFGPGRGRPRTGRRRGLSAPG